MNIYKFILLLWVLSFTFIKCKNTPNRNPFGASVPCSFDENSYGPDTSQMYDIYIPQVGLPNNAKFPIVIYIHGGGFVNGDKRDNMNPSINNPKVASLLNDNIAFASINYRVLNQIDNVGIIKSIQDSKNAINHIINNYNVDPTKVALWGSSAGAGISLLLGYGGQIDVKALYVNMTQATYDMQLWGGSNGVFNSCTSLQICNTITANRIKNIYGMGSSTLTNCNDIINASASYRNTVDIFNKITNGPEPPVWIQNNNLSMNGSYNCTSLLDTIYHHQRHSSRLKDRVVNMNKECHLELMSQIYHWNNAGMSPINGIEFIKSKI